MLKLEDVSLHYGSLQALQHIDLAIEKGDFACLLGPNGAGKSTLLRVAAGTLPPTAGRVLFQERDMALVSRRDMARRLAFVPQNVLVDFPFTVREVVLMGRAPHQGFMGLEQGRDLEIVEAALRQMQLESLAERRMGQLSGGEAQRTMIAAALAQEPEVLLLDEPTSHLDIKFQVEVLEVLAELNARQNLTVVMTVHDLNLAAQFGRRLVLLRAGRIHSQGTPAETLTTERLREVYDLDVAIGTHPHDGTPQVSLLRPSRKPV